MKKYFRLFYFLFLIPILYVPENSFSQNVGIGTTTPAEKLDVNGNINVTGTIKTNGVDGAANQVLMKNSSGVLAWGNMVEYKNYTTFLFTTSGANQSWIVPAGVTKISVQAWGGGGKAHSVCCINIAGAGGGGGGYIEGYLAVVPGTTVNIAVGSGANSTINFAQFSTITYNSQTLSAWPASNASANSGNEILPGIGGTFSSNIPNYIGMTGENGKPSIVRFDQVSTSEFTRAIYHGDGGNAPNTLYTAGKGGFSSTGTISYSLSIGSKGTVPGGGGGAGNYTSDNAGGNGMVIIRY
ncbi:glycine-rich domain-containing protein [Ferruginibacter sp.]